MTPPAHIEIELELKKLELQALLEITDAINENASETHLYKMFRFTLRPNRHIEKLALYVLDDVWNCKEAFGALQDYKNMPLSADILNQDKDVAIETMPDIGVFAEFQQLLTIKHKSNILAYILLSFKNLENLSDTVTETLTDFIRSLTNIIIVAIENKKLIRKQQQQEQLKAQLELARNVQTLLFPKKLPYSDKLKVVADYLPHQTVGGDYYDYIPINADKFLLCIADVSGKGIPAALLMSNFQAALRILVRQHLSLKKIVHELNYLVLQNTQGESFITAFFMEYDAKQKQMLYVNAGHNPPLLFSANQSFHSLKDGTTILGSFKELPFLQLTELNQIDTFLLFAFTDGLTETTNMKEEEFGAANLEEFLTANRNIDQKELHKKLIAKLDEFKGENPYADDITLLSCSVKSQ